VTACASSATLRPDSTDSAVRGPTPLIFTSWRKVLALGRGEEAEEHLRVLAHDEVRQQRTRSPSAGRLQKVLIGTSTS
jgi:hypothetical protein